MFSKELKDLIKNLVMAFPDTPKRYIKFRFVTTVHNISGTTVVHKRYCVVHYSGRHCRSSHKVLA